MHREPFVSPIPFKEKVYESLRENRQPFKTHDGQVVKIFDAEDDRFCPNSDVMEIRMWI